MRGGCVSRSTAAMNTCPGGYEVGVSVEEWSRSRCAGIDLRIAMAVCILCVHSILLTPDRGMRCAIRSVVVIDFVTCTLALLSTVACQTTAFSNYRYAGSYMGSGSGSAQARQC